MSQEVKIGVNANASGAEREVAKVADAADDTADAIGRIDKQAKQAAASIDKLAEAGARLARTQELLERQLGHKVTPGDAAQFESNFQRMRSGRGLGGQRYRQFSDFEGWYFGHSRMFRTPGDAASHRRATFARGLEGTSESEEAPPPPDTPPGPRPSAFPSGVSRAASAGMGFGKSMLALAGVSFGMSTVSDAMNSATDEGVSLDTTKRRMGDLGVAFEALRDQARSAADGLGITYVESSKLAAQYAREAGNLHAGDVQGGAMERSLRNAYGFARASGLDPSDTVGSFGTMRRLGVTNDDPGSRKFAAMIADAVERGGYSGKADEVLEAVSNFANLAARQSLITPNVGAYTGALASLMGSGLPGLDPGGAAALLGAADSSFRRGGAKGDASQNFEFMALLHGHPGMTPFATQALMQAGLFGTSEGVFGGGPLKGWYGGPQSGVTNFSLMRTQLNQSYKGSQARIAALAGAMGISIPQAAALYGMSDNQLSASSSLMGRMHLGPDSVNPTAYGLIANIANASAGGLRGIYGQLAGRDDISTADKAGMQKALDSGSAEGLRQALVTMAAKYGQEADAGSRARADIADIKNALTDAGAPMVAALNAIEEGIFTVAKFFGGPGYGEAKHKETGWQAAVMAVTNPALATAIYGAMPAAEGSAGGGGNFVGAYSGNTVRDKVRAFQQNSKYDSIFRAAGAKYGIDWRELKLHADMESGFDPDVAGPKTKYGQAFGLMQVVGMHGNWKDPNANIFAGAAKLAAAYRQAKGNLSVMDELYYSGSMSRVGPNAKTYATNAARLRPNLGMGEGTDAGTDAPAALPTAPSTNVQPPATGPVHAVSVHVTSDPIVLTDSAGAARGTITLKPVVNAKPAGS